MKISEVVDYIGRVVVLNGSGDLCIERRYRRYVDDCVELRVVGITRGGLVFLANGKDRLSVPVRNIDLVSAGG